MTVAATLWSEVEAHPDHDLLRLHGDLSLATAPRARRLLGKLLHDRGAVVVDVSQLRVRWRAAVEIFAGALSEAGGWPVARLVVAGADADLTKDLQSIRVDRTVPVVADLAAASRRLWMRPERVSRQRDLPAVVGSPAAARTLVREACADWDVPGVVDVATLVVSELVTNVLEHTNSDCRVSLTIMSTALHVRVRDFAPGVPPRPRPAGPKRPGGRGLHLVTLLADTWGVQQHPDGKTVWAAIKLSS
jgi:anti-sigma regulatory factor (Ser/Thr protein kinase)